MKKIIYRVLPILFILTAIILFFPTIVFQDHVFVHSGVVFSDLFSFNYPVKKLLYDSLRNGQIIPLWTDLIGNGYPMFAEGQLGALYPLQLLILILPFSFPHAFVIYTLLQYFLAGLFIFILLRQSFTLSKKSSLIGSLVYMFCGTSLTNLQHINVLSVMIYLPLDLLIVDQLLKIQKTTSRRTLNQFSKVSILLIISVFFQIAAGHIETVYYNAAATIIYALVSLIFKHKYQSQLLKKVLVALVSVSAAVLIATPQLMATFELVKYSQREAGVSFENATSQPWPIQTLILFINPKAYPTFTDGLLFKLDDGVEVNVSVIYPYIGLLSIIFILFAIFLVFKKTTKQQILKRQTIIILILTLIIYLYAIGSSTSLFSIIWQLIPGVKMFRFPAKTIYIIELCLSVLSAVGFELFLSYILEKIKYNSKIVSSICFILISILIFIDLWINNSPIQPTLPISFWLNQPETARFLNPENDQSFKDWRVHSVGPDITDTKRIVDVNLQRDLQSLLFTNYNMIYNIPLYQAYVGLLLKENIDFNFNHPHINSENHQLIISPEMNRALDLQSVKYSVSDLHIDKQNDQIVNTFQFVNPYQHKITFFSGGDNQFIPSDKTMVYQRPDYVPRIRIIDSKDTIYFKQSENQSDILKKLFDKEFKAKDSLIVQIDELPVSENQTLTKKDFKIKSYTQTETTITTSTDAVSWLTINDTYYPGWTATIEQKEQTIYRANSIFRAIQIPAGEHQIEFKYKPEYIQKGIYGALVGVLILSTIAVIFISTRSSATSQSELV